MAREAVTAESLRGRLLIVGGMSRAGTTYLYNQLPRHPQIVTTAEKELCYFGHNSDHQLDWWLSRCAPMDGDDVALDVCGLYFAEYETAIPRIQAFDPQARVVLTIRDPDEWIYSVYEHYSSIWTTPPFRDFLGGCTWMRDGRPIKLSFGNGRIRDSTLAFAREFGDRLLVCDFKMLSQDPVRLLQNIERFAGLNRFFEEANVERRKYHERMNSGAQLMQRLVTIHGFRTVARMVPALVRAPIRRMIERGGDASEPSAIRHEYAESDQAFARQILAEDAEFYARLFNDHSILRGGLLEAMCENQRLRFNA